jgi:two-component SAPR family response regulator
MARLRKEVDRLIDEVAIKRAMEGDRSAYQNLTGKERILFYDRVSVKSDQFRKTYGHYKGNNFKEPEFDWLNNLRDNLGINYDAMDQNIVRARRRAR